jgi:hypothetical protein
MKIKQVFKGGLWITFQEEVSPTVEFAKSEVSKEHDKITQTFKFKKLDPSEASFTFIEFYAVAREFKMIAFGSRGLTW